MKKGSSYDIIFKLFFEHGWISNIDYFKATNGSPKLATRISEMSRDGVPIKKQMVVSETGKRHMEYALNIEE